MKITIGSQNSTKVAAVSELIKDYPLLQNAEVKPLKIEIEEFGHPKSLDEVVEGAIERAKKAYQECDYSIGIESGLMKVPQCKSGYVEIAACAIYDGEKNAIGFNTAFEWPKKVLDLIIDKGLDGSQATKESGLTTHSKIGTAEGIIHLLTKGRLSRKEQTKQALMMALIHLENRELY